MKILALCGSLQAESSNLQLLRAAIALAPHGVEVTVYDGIRALPLFNPDLEGESAPPAVADWRSTLASSDGLLIASPEYGHSLPGALKNAIDWVIGSGELNRKVVAVTASAAGPGRGVLGLNALLGTLAAVDATVVGGAPIVRGPTFEREVAALLGALVEKVREGSGA
jgi:NAD(P)H-dependent FMN reductase